MKLKKLWLVSTATLFSLLIVEALARLILPAPGARPFPPHYIPGLIVPHSTRHYAYAPGFKGRSDTGEYHIDVGINSLGLRDDEIIPNERIDILAAGNSFTVGFGVQAEDTWPAQLESHINSASVMPRNIRVLNAAVSGYSLTQIRLLIEELLNLEPRIVVLGLYASADLRRRNPYVYCGGHAVASDIAPHLRVTEDRFLFSPFDDEGIRHIHFWLMRNWHLAAHTLDLLHELTIKETAPGEPKLTSQGSSMSLMDELENVRQLLEDRGVGLVVLPVNPQRKDGTFNDLQKRYNSAITAHCKSTGITVFDPLPLLEASSKGRPVFRIGSDHHWSGPAHKLVAEGLGDFLLQQPWIVDSLTTN
jgi:hypothetical protein